MLQIIYPAHYCICLLLHFLTFSFAFKLHFAFYLILKTFLVDINLFTRITSSFTFLKQGSHLPRTICIICFNESKKSRDCKRFLFLSYPLMMNIQSLGSKESAGVKFKEGICAELFLKLWFGSNCYFCNITKSGWF